MRKGFTSMELLIIIACIGILFVIGITGMQDVKETYKESEFVIVHSRGESMTPCWIEGEDRLLQRGPVKIGDAIAFKCKSEKCGFANGEKMTKFLLGRKGNCYWVVDCHRDSWDSKDYGWLCGEEIDIHGVITLIK